ncbi:unnamed protein product, partial [Brachionus calyciflorus]
RIKRHKGFVNRIVFIKKKMNSKLVLIGLIITFGLFMQVRLEGNDEGVNDSEPLIENEDALNEKLNEEPNLPAQDLPSNLVEKDQEVQAENQEEKQPEQEEKQEEKKEEATTAETPSNLEEKNENGFFAYIEQNKTQSIVIGSISIVILLALIAAGVFFIIKFIKNREYQSVQTA